MIGRAVSVKLINLFVQIFAKNPELILNIQKLFEGYQDEPDCFFVIKYNIFFDFHEIFYSGKKNHNLSKRPSFIFKSRKFYPKI